MAPPLISPLNNEGTRGFTTTLHTPGNPSLVRLNGHDSFTLYLSILSLSLTYSLTQVRHTSAPIPGIDSPRRLQHTVYPDVRIHYAHMSMNTQMYVYITLT